jgi:hypothetical protein
MRSIKMLHANGEHYMRLTTLVFFAFLTGCSTHQTTLKQDGGYKIYAIEEQKIFQLTYQEITSIVDDEIVNEIDGPERGFSTRMTWGLDWYNVFVKIVPVEGVSLSGKNVKGYFVELGGKGTYPTSRPQKIIDNIQKKLEESGTGVMVSSYRKSSYQLERDRWRLNEKASARDNGDSVMDRLLKLKVLRDEGVLSEGEYQEKKSELLKQL